MLEIFTFCIFSRDRERKRNIDRILENREGKRETNMDRETDRHVHGKLPMGVFPKWNRNSVNSANSRNLKITET